ncbi:Serine/threonine-protein kinase [Xylographa trunciseda]|nr:Serine/threonine-protein kinase [Xylographa trunciseda]
MISNDNRYFTSRSDDEHHDHIGSQSATPSGVATPRPDPSDKRLPQIMHGYFGQVGTSSTTSSSGLDRCAVATPALDRGVASHTPAHHRNGDHLGKALPTAPSSPKRSSHDDSDHTVQLLGHEQLGLPKLEGAYAYPSPPISSPSSIHKDIDGSLGTGSRTCSREGSVAGRPYLGRQLSATDVIPLRTRRHTAGLKSLSAITTDSPVHAAYFSNPTSARSSTTPSTPTLDSPHTSALSSLASSYLELVKLTENVALSPRQKSTPPHTPRALSNDALKVPATVAKPTQSPPDDTVFSAAQQEIKKPSGSDNLLVSNNSPPVGPPKGKLFVKITEARGLRPSYEPYVVCVFEWNEYISKGPKQEDSDTEKEDIKLKDEPLGAVPIRRSGSDMGRAMAIPMKSRQGSTTSLSDQKNFKSGKQVTDPKWDHEATFDVLGASSDLDIYVYDRSDHEAFLGHVRISLDARVDNNKIEGWYKLEPRNAEEETVSGEIHLQLQFQKTDKKHYGPEDFQILKLIGKGTFGQVYQVRKKDTQRIYAMKVLSKKVIVQKKEVAHTLGERNILVRTAMADSPFIVGLKFSFQTPTDLYLVTDFMSGGELFWHLQKEGRFNEARAKFYIAELILALQHLHDYNIVYRDLKPENILLDANGHIALCDFGLSKANLTKNDTTNTFCGTTEYLAPEVLLDEQGYTTMVDFWSLGVLVFEMCCGWSPFYAEDTQQMYKNIAFGKVRFPRDALSTEGRNFVKGLLNRNPKHRLGAINDAEELKAHPFFSDIDWVALTKKMVVPPFKPKLKSVLDTSNFDPEFTNALTNSSSLNARAAALSAGVVPASTPLSPGMQANFKGFTFVDESNLDEHFKSNELESMEEDEREGEAEDNWEQAFDHKHRPGDRMSGIIKTSGGEDTIFNNHFDD